MEKRKISSTDETYRHGNLSIFPQMVDSKATLFDARNSAEATLRHSITPSSKYIIVDNASAFPDNGILRITDGNAWESIYYHRKVGNQFHSLHRGYLKTNQAKWLTGALVSCPVMAEHHNALKDAVIKIEKTIGTKTKPDPTSITGLVEKLEKRWLAPKAMFRAYPVTGKAPLLVQFKNFSGGHAAKFLWDFGDGATSNDKDPEHTYRDEGIFTVKLGVISSNNTHGFVIKKDLVSIDNTNKDILVHATQTKPNEFLFTDQSDIVVSERHWFFGDGQEHISKKNAEHTVLHTYKSGVFQPTIVFTLPDGQIIQSKYNQVEVA